MLQQQKAIGEPLGPWTHQHSLGAAVVIVIVLVIAATIWPGWDRVGAWFFP
jgi:hypothetical protein